ncbi:MAG: hypothetical protein EBU08_16690 [Micrococcales bacterium]|jgi:hypothetical protein|nr:hypothetical protein [Micrococcales bacterium]
MFTPAQQTATENYNETILIPILHKKVNQLTADNILLEAQVQILEKEKKVLEEKLNSQPVPQVEVLNTSA